VFQVERARLFAIAYRMLGAVGDAEDVIQEAFLRFREQKPDSAPALLTTIVVRLCLDHLKSARVRREQYVGLWLPEPLPTNEHTVDRDSIAMAFLILLETLSPDERAVYVLAEVFDFSHEEIARTLDKRVGTCRQLLRRARARVGRRERRFSPTTEQRDIILKTFVRVCETGDLSGMRSLLASNVCARADGGGKIAAARKMIEGRDRVARYLVGIARRIGADTGAATREMNGMPALFLQGRMGFKLVAILELNTSLQISNVDIVVNPDKLVAAERAFEGIDSRRSCEIVFSLKE
jgi:RNA polymerase sigma-70 factor (ECF subfamily)